MKRMTRFLMVVFVVLLVLAPLTGAQAGTWRFATPLLAGALSDGQNYVLLTSTDGAWSGQRYFSANCAYKNAILATVLTAISMGKPVYFYFDDNTFVNWSTISGAAIDMR